VEFLEFDKVASLSNIHVHITLLFHESKGVVDLGELLLVQSIRELYFEYDEEVSMLVGLLVVRHTKIFNGLNLIGLDNFTNLVLYSDFSSI